MHCPHTKQRTAVDKSLRHQEIRKNLGNSGNRIGQLGEKRERYLCSSVLCRPPEPRIVYPLITNTNCKATPVKVSWKSDAWGKRFIREKLDSKDQQRRSPLAPKLIETIINKKVLSQLLPKSGLQHELRNGGLSWKSSSSCWGSDCLHNLKKPPLSINFLSTIKKC